MNQFLDIGKQSSSSKENTTTKKKKSGGIYLNDGGYVLQNQPSEIQEVSSYQEDDDASNIKHSNLD
ncbi:UNKNOWN [Stylonychia lemnae]|uniref:Uncharacterized protein n=1 Tax=Stylonychia lemnae TaxID=5949 RepID=A0A078AAK9_STYLE|nr:UNKNOWN [Stylonychia lemnae]|eukprot:CDW77833.1 UNKNOWN [Stylonychia lemnae]